MTHQQQLAALEREVQFKLARFERAQRKGQGVEAARRALETARRELAAYKTAHPSATPSKAVALVRRTTNARNVR